MKNINFDAIKWNSTMTNKEGGTMSPNGRFKNFKSGYTIAITKAIHKQLDNEVKEIYTLGEIQNLYRRAMSKFPDYLKTNYGDLYIGFWKDNNKTYYDIVIKTQSKNWGIALANSLKEIAIWDNKKNEEIRI